MRAYRTDDDCCNTDDGDGGDLNEDDVGDGDYGTRHTLTSRLAMSMSASMLPQT
jgi:hypothetical protein